MSILLIQRKQKRFMSDKNAYNEGFFNRKIENLTIHTGGILKIMACFKNRLGSRYFCSENAYEFFFGHNFIFIIITLFLICNYFFQNYEPRFSKIIKYFLRRIKILFAI